MAGESCLLFVIACLSWSSCMSSEEPRCSKFDFEEKLLEKMVRMEHSGGLMMEEFRKLTANVKDSLGAMRSEFDEIKREAQEERKRSTQMVRGMWQFNSWNSFDSIINLLVFYFANVPKLFTFIFIKKNENVVHRWFEVCDNLTIAIVLTASLIFWFAILRMSRIYLLSFLSIWFYVILVAKWQIISVTP